MKYVDVILPLPLSSMYTYVLPEDLRGKVRPGCRVIVPFGSKKIYTAIVMGLHEEVSVSYTIKEVLELLDEHPVLLPLQLDLWSWIADYYLCSIGEVYKAALPSGMKLESESKVVLNQDYEPIEDLTVRERQVVELLQRKPEQTIQQLQRDMGMLPVLHVVNTLLDKGVLTMKEEVKRSYKPKTEVHLRLTEKYMNSPALHEAFNELKRAPKQLHVLMHYIEMADVSTVLHLQNPALLKEVGRKELLNQSGATMAVCRALVEKNILEIYAYETGRLSQGRMDVAVPPSLSEAQQKAFRQITESFRTHRVCLFHGVTSSGKTEVYIHLIKQMIESNKQVLYLVPEIVLTTQLTDRLYKIFGNRMGIYHSKFPDAERVEIWQKQLSDKPYDIIVGVRSSVFLPFQRLGLVIVDEEHEATYKQQDPAPRYHARNSAIVLAQKIGAHVLLGTATPALETYYNARTGKYALVELNERFRNVQLPEIEVVDIRELQHKRRMTGPFSPLLLNEIRRALANKEQVILFQNRRGYAPMIECHTCGWVPKCSNCDVSLTYHKGLNQLTCHYCGYTYRLPLRCPACESTELVNKGFGTEKIEDDIQLIFPEASVGRMDLDTTRSRSAYETILSDFQSGKTDILIGTQMVTKGLDFEHVSVVGILNADTMLNLPDFRSYERAFQMMAQVAGRAGRRQIQGRVILQTKSPELPVVHQVVAHDYLSLYLQQMEERQMFGYPPFCRLIYVYMKHKRAEVSDRLAKEMALSLRMVFAHRVLGPDTPAVSRIQLLYIRKLVLKVEPGAAMSKVREQLLYIRGKMLAVPEFRSAQIYYDVDPL